VSFLTLKRVRLGAPLTGPSPVRSSRGFLFLPYFQGGFERPIGKKNVVFVSTTQQFKTRDGTAHPQHHRQINAETAVAV
jgi:hypothetical protein